MSDQPADLLGPVFLRERPVLLRCLLRMVGSLAIAEELIQDAYLKVAAALLDRQVDHLAPFLHQTARNLALDHLRATRRRCHLMVPAHAVDRLDEIPAATPCPETGARDRQRLRHLGCALSRLTARQQRIFALSRVEGVALGEIAARLEVSRSTVEKDLRAAMLACLSACGEERGRG